MLWVTWRQHRGMLVSVTAVLAAVAIFLLIAGLKVHHDYTALVNCHPVNSDACAAKHNYFNNTDWTMGNTILILMNLAPALLGVFTGPAVLARELETGTFRYAWTQGIGRVRWTIAKLTLLAAVIAVLAWLVLREDYPVAINTTNMNLFNGPNTANSPWILKTWTVGNTPWSRYIPVSRFWPMQFIEAGWLLILAIALGAATVWLVRRRAA
jgi:hypothetical protein